MKIGVLTSTRADFGIYYPLLKQLQQDKLFEIEIIAFGTHLKKEYGYTINEIKELGFVVNHTIETHTANDTPEDISRSIGNTVSTFSGFWNRYTFDLVLALGDRYEMFAAVSSASPYNIDFAHIHAGETTLGAIDNAYRHSISVMSKYVFVTTEQYKRRAAQVLNSGEFVFNVGALSIDNLKNQKLLTKEEFYNAYNIDLNRPSILSTFHPETVSYKKNEEYIKELIKAFKVLNNKYQIIITLPNTDTMGDVIRNELKRFQVAAPQVKLVESFGMIGYLSCMKYASFLLGNTSSGFVEASFFPKWVINIGNRQEGRIVTQNILNVPVKKEHILKAVTVVESTPLPYGTNIYGDGNAAANIVTIIKQIYGLE